MRWTAAPRSLHDYCLRWELYHSRSTKDWAVRSILKFQFTDHSPETYHLSSLPFKKPPSLTSFWLTCKLSWWTPSFASLITPPRGRGMAFNLTKSTAFSQSTKKIAQIGPVLLSAHQRLTQSGIVTVRVDLLSLCSMHIKANKKPGIPEQVLWHLYFSQWTRYHALCVDFDKHQHCNRVNHQCSVYSLPAVMNIL